MKSKLNDVKKLTEIFILFIQKIYNEFSNIIYECEIGQSL